MWTLSWCRHLSAPKTCHTQSYASISVYQLLTVLRNILQGVPTKCSRLKSNFQQSPFQMISNQSGRQRPQCANFCSDIMSKSRADSSFSEKKYDLKHTNLRQVLSHVKCANTEQTGNVTKMWTSSIEAYLVKGGWRWMVGKPKIAEMQKSSYSVCQISAIKLIKLKYSE